MTPDAVLEALRQWVLAGLALVTSLGGAAGGLPARMSPKAVLREVLSVPRLPSGEVLTVDQVDETETDVDESETEDPEDVEGDDLEEIDPQELDEPVDVQCLLLRGPISQRPAEAVIGTWTIAGRDVQVTEATVVSTRAANAQVGDWAQVQVAAQAPAEEDTTTEGGDGAEPTLVTPATLVARSLSVMSSDKLGRVVGIIESIGEKDETGASTWVVSGVSVTVNGSTHIVGTPAVGHLADVHGSMTVDSGTPDDAAPPDEEEPTPQDNDNEGVTEEDTGDEAAVEEGTVSFVARLVVVRGTPNLPKEERQWQKQQGQGKTQTQSAVELSGVIESIDSTAGTWVISGQTVQVNAATSIDEKKGAAEVNAQVRVLAEQQEDGSLVALEIQVLRAKGGNGGNKGGNAVKPDKENPGQGKKK